MLGSKAAVSQSAKRGMQALGAATVVHQDPTAAYAKKVKNFQAAVTAAHIAHKNGHLETVHSSNNSNNESTRRACYAEDVTVESDDDEDKDGGDSMRFDYSESRQVEKQFNKMMTQTDVSKPADPHAEQEMMLNKIMGVVIVLNAIMMAIELDYGPEDGAPLKDRVFWIIVESVFIILFIIELCIRLNWERFEWVKSYWNWLDLLVISVGVVESWIISFIDASGSELRMVTLLRIVRLVRLLRVAKLVRSYRAFYVTVMAFRDALESIGNILLIMVAGLFLCGIFTTSTIGRSEELRNTQMGEVNGEQRFGTIPRSMYSLFELMTLEGWEQVGRPLVTKEPSMGIFLFFFILVFSFGLINMIVAMVVEKTLKQQSLMDAHVQKESHEEVQNDLADFYRIEDTFDKGYLTLKEFEAQLNNEEHAITMCLQKSGVPTDDVETLFSILNINDDGQLTVAELFGGIGRIHSALSNNVSFELCSLKAKLRSLQKDVKKLTDRSTRSTKSHAKSIMSATDTRTTKLSTTARDSIGAEDSIHAVTPKSVKSKSPDCTGLNSLRRIADSEFHKKDSFGESDGSIALVKFASSSIEDSLSRRTSDNTKERGSWSTPQPPPLIEHVMPPTSQPPATGVVGIDSPEIPGTVWFQPSDVSKDTSSVQKDSALSSVPSKQVEAVGRLSLPTSESEFDFIAFARSQASFQETLMRRLDNEVAARSEMQSVLLGRLDASFAKQEDIRERLVTVEHSVKNWLGQSA